MDNETGKKIKYNSKFKEGYVCPLPPRWAQIHGDLLKYKSTHDNDPPIPLILGAWFCSDGAKNEAWEEMKLWAVEHNLSHLTTVREDEKYFG